MTIEHVKEPNADTEDVVSEILKSRWQMIIRVCSGQ